MKASNARDQRLNKPKNANGKETAAKKGASLPSVPFRKGDGPTRGIAEKFPADPITGTGLVKFPIYTGPDRSGFRPQLTLFAYALTVVAVGGAVVATLQLGSAVKHTPTLFFCSVVLSSWIGGLGPGIFAGLLSAIALDYYFIPPIYALGIGLEEAPDMIVFVVSAVFVSWLNRGQSWAKDSVRQGYLAHPPTLRLGQESVFFKQGDYWTIQYQGQIAHLKATRGLQCLAALLGYPGREFHVSELIAPVAEVPIAAVAGLSSVMSGNDGHQMRTACFQDAGPILDAHAKGEYRRRLVELRDELEEAEGLNDPERARKARQERDCIADQLAMAVGLGGRTRKAASQAERARSAVTKRIKDSIKKIAEAIPPLGRHLAVTIKTGYFCCYNPNPDRPAKWEVRS